jgi:hypothetical protein
MKIGWILVYLTLAITLVAQQDPSVPEGRIVRLNLDSNTVTLLRLKPGYVSSVRVPDEVSSVVLGDPGSFKAEHSESEPRLVFLKPTTSAPAETNALITTRNGREVSLHLINAGISDQGPVDFVLEYTMPRALLVDDSFPSFVIAESHSLGNTSGPPPNISSDLHSKLEELLNKQSETRPPWQGKKLRVALGKISDAQEDMIVAFSVMNASSKTIELLPPQIQLAGASRSKHGRSITADQVPVTEYKMTTRRLAPEARADVVVAFERPTFKQSSEQMLLQVAEAESVDRPVLLPIPFVVPAGGIVR